MVSPGDSMVSGAEKDCEHWRFVSVQTRGCLSVTRRSDKQREQQLQLAGYLAMREYGVVGMGGTCLGDGASDIARLARTALNGLYNDDTNTAACDEATGPSDRTQSRPSAAIYSNGTNTERGTRPGQDPIGHGTGVTNLAGPDSNIYNNTNMHNNNTNDDKDGARPPAGRSVDRPLLRVGLTYDAAGSHKTANGVWRGGVLLGSLGEATKRMEGRVGGCRGWGRYIGRIYRGASEKTMVVIETYQFQSMITSSALSDCSVAMAMVSLAQRWCGSSTPVNMLSTDELHLHEPLDATAPLAAHMFHELRRLGCKVAVGWVVQPPAAGDETIYDAYMREAGVAGRAEAEISRLTAAPSRRGLANHLGLRARPASRGPGAPCRRDPRPLPARPPLRSDLLCCPQRRHPSLLHMFRCQITLRHCALRC